MGQLAFGERNTCHLEGLMEGLGVREAPLWLLPSVGYVI